MTRLTHDSPRPHDVTAHVGETPAWARHFRNAERFPSYRNELLADAELLQFHLIDDFVSALHRLSMPRYPWKTKRIHRDEWAPLGNDLTGRTHGVFVDGLIAKLQTVCS